MNSLNSDYKLYLKLLRPWQWAKNTLIIIPIVLSNSFGLDKFLDSIGIFFLFSFYVSGNYILNDLNDIDLDRNHPEKKYRPIASGEVSEKIAKRIAYFLLISSLLITFINYEVEIVYLYLIYLFIAVVYTKSLKFVNFIDSIAISTLYDKTDNRRNSCKS